MSTDRITRQDFCRVYVPMALAGATALAIANELGVDKPTDEEKSQFVSQKASNYRKELRAAAAAAAAEEGLDEEATKALVDKAAAKLPKLKSRTRETEDFAAFLDELIASCDGEDSVETPS